MVPTYASKKSRRSQQKVQTSGERLISWYQDVDIRSIEFNEQQQERAHEAFLEWVGGDQTVTQSLMTSFCLHDPCSSVSLKTFLLLNASYMK